mmetsp:Transcript_13298/g.19028  ORF Transcript_13298/g.19028 Transcript_13298/m.19028 type:complete len:300 (-) Transcript_13298:402-1301(-)
MPSRISFWDPPKRNGRPPKWSTGPISPWKGREWMLVPGDPLVMPRFWFNLMELLVPVFLVAWTATKVVVKVVTVTVTVSIMRMVTIIQISMMQSSGEYSLFTMILIITSSTNNSFKPSSKSSRKHSMRDSITLSWWIHTLPHPTYPLEDSMHKLPYSLHPPSMENPLHKTSFNAYSDAPSLQIRLASLHHIWYSCLPWAHKELTNSPTPCKTSWEENSPNRQKWKKSSSTRSNPDHQIKHPSITQSFTSEISYPMMMRRSNLHFKLHHKIRSMVKLECKLQPMHCSRLSHSNRLPEMPQ